MVKRLLDFLNASPVNFLAAKNIASYLEQAGYRRLDPQVPIGESQCAQIIRKPASASGLRPMWKA